MKTVFVCAAGMNRSHALAINAKQLFSWDCFPVGVWANPSVFPMVSAWADRIVLLERWWPEHFIPKEHLDKVAWLDLGVDVWGSPVHPNLNEFVVKMLLAWQTREFKAGLLITQTGKIEDVLDARPGATA